MARAAGLLALAAGACCLRAETIPVPNGSFESPATPFVSVNVDAWQKAPKPDWYVETAEFLWSYNIGLFKNPATNSADHIDNLDGAQAIWLFAVPEVALFQDYDSVDWRNPEPTHAFNARYEAGKSYRLTVGVIGSGGGMQPGATMELSMYYRDALSNQVTVAALSITNTATVFSNNTHFLDFRVEVPVVRPEDAWAGRHIGVRMRSTVDPALQGGYWDLDNVRLSAILEPVLSDPLWSEDRFQFTVRSEPALNIEILSATDLSLPFEEWRSLGVLTNSSGSIRFIDTTSDPAGRFYRARRVP